MVTPYFTQQSPPALVATLPPIEQNWNEAGSGGYQRPCSAAAALTSALNAPGCETTVRVTGSTVISRMRSSESTMQPLIAVEPPESPEPAPRGTIGTFAAAARRTTVCTSSVLVTRTTTRGVPALGSFARSQRYASIEAGFVMTLPSGRAATSASIREVSAGNMGSPFSG